MTRQPILDAIPHREPFLLVDEIVEWTENRIVCTKTFTGKEDFFAGHYPHFPLVPGVLLCEAAMQAGAILLSRHLVGKGDRTLESTAQDEESHREKGPVPLPGNFSGKVPVATRMNDVRFKRMVRPGETIRLEVELTERLADAFFLQAKVTVEGKVAVRFEFACTAASP